MSANRLSWIIATLVVLVVGFLIFRTLRNDTATRSNSMSMPQRSEAPASGSAIAPRPTGSDTARARAPEQRISSVEQAKLVIDATYRRALLPHEVYNECVARRSRR